MNSVLKEVIENEKLVMGKSASSIRQLWGIWCIVDVKNGNIVGKVKYPTVEVAEKMLEHAEACGDAFCCIRIRETEIEDLCKFIR